MGLVIRFGLFSCAMLGQGEPRSHFPKGSNRHTTQAYLRLSSCPSTLLSVFHVIMCASCFGEMKHVSRLGKVHLEKTLTLSIENLKSISKYPSAMWTFVPGDFPRNGKILVIERPLNSGRVYYTSDSRSWMRSSWYFSVIFLSPCILWSWNCCSYCLYYKEHHCRMMAQRRVTFYESAASGFGVHIRTHTCEEVCKMGTADSCWAFSFRSCKWVTKRCAICGHILAKLIFRLAAEWSAEASVHTGVKIWEDANSALFLPAGLGLRLFTKKLTNDATSYGDSVGDDQHWRRGGSL